MIKLSIIIPVHNEAPYLRRCLDSIRLTPEAEVILIDDGSTDGSADILKEYEELPRHGFAWVTLYNRTSWGVSMARHKGLCAARGEWVTFLDSDDEYSKKAVNIMLRATEDNEGQDVVMFNHTRVYGSMNPVLRINNPRGVYTLRNMPEKWQTVWSKMFRRSFLFENGITFKPGVQYGEDEHFVLQCMRARPTLFHSDAITVVKHFDNPASLCHTLDKHKLIGLTRALEDLLEKDNPEGFDGALRQIIADHWNSKTFKGFLGE